MKKIYLPILLFLSLLYMPFSSTIAHGGQVTYCAHIAYDGWLGWVSDGQTAGSPGSGKEMQAVKIKVTGFPPTYHIYYQAHVAHDGWLSWVSDGEVAGTIGEAKQMEALKIELRGFPSNYHVTYRAYVQSSGWQSWVSDGAVAGTTGQAKAMEALQIKIYAEPPHITSISPTQVKASTFDLTINGSNFDDGAVDQIYWKADGHFVGQGTILSRSSTRIVVREYMEGTDPGTYVVKVENSDGQLSNGMDLEITHENQPPEAKITMTSGGQTAYENQTLNLTVSPGGTAHIDFSASRSFDPDGSISGYRWKISGDQVSTSRNFGFDLGEGTHDIYLTVTDNEGAEGSVGASIVITEEAENQPPEAKITMTSGGQTVYENQTLNLTVSPGGTAHIDFSASRSFDPDC